MKYLKFFESFEGYDDELVEFLMEPGADQEPGEATSLTHTSSDQEPGEATSLTHTGGEEDEMETKLDSIKDSLPKNVDFSWERQVEGDQKFLFIHLYMGGLDLNLQWNIDLDTPKIIFIAEGTNASGEDVSEESFTMDLSNIDEALEMVKKSAIEMTMVSEKKKYKKKTKFQKNI